MLKWSFRVLLIVVLSVVGYNTFDLYRGGFFSLPKLSDNEYPLSFSNGLRGIVEVPLRDAPQRPAPKLFRGLVQVYPDRTYLGVPYEVPSWLSDKWSDCTSDGIDENEVVRRRIVPTMPERLRADLIGARLEYVCSFDLGNGEKVIRGYVFSVPKF